MTTEIKREKHELDATDIAVGRLATQIAILLRGKNRPDFVPHIDSGAHVKVINASKLKFTGRKLAQKDYYRHTQYPGGLRTIAMGKVFAKDPTEVVRKAVYGMLPKNKLRNEMLKRLTIKA